MEKPMKYTATEEQIFEIVYDEFNEIITKIETDFKNNYQKKRNNFLLDQFDNQLTANMVFVSSFESKSGNAIEAVIKRVTRLKYGNENVPDIINPNNIKHNIPVNPKQQILVTNVDIENSELAGKISEFREARKSKRGINEGKSQVNQDSIKGLLEFAEHYRTETVCVKPVDLAFYDGKDWNILELKAGGNLDSSNAPSNVQKLLTIYVGLNNPNSKIYFGTIYNKDGEGNLWKSAVKKYLEYPSMFLIGSELWEKILPKDISYNDFVEIYSEALNKLDINNRIQEMIRKAAN